MTADGPSVIRCLMCLAPLFDSVVGCLASSAPNAAKVRQAVQAPSQEAEQPNLVLPGYAKGGDELSFGHLPGNPSRDRGGQFGERVWRISAGP